jgi:NitT/TauT family transport system substrate-binding protein
MVDIELKRGYEVLPDNDVRFGIRVINVSHSAISEVEVILDYNASLFELTGSEVQKLGTIPHAGERTAKFTLKPRGCIHKEEIAATIRYKDHQWKRHSVEMRPKEVHCVCPFLKEKTINRADFLALAASGYGEDRGLNFEAITIDKLIAFLLHTCQNRLYRVDDVSVEQGRILYLAADAVGEKAYYLLTAVVVEQEGIIQVLLRASSDKRHGLIGFLNELIENLRHLVSSVARAREIGIIKQEQVINIIDSVVQRTTFAAAGGEGAPSVTIKDSVVQRTEIKADEAAKGRRREEEEEEERKRLRREEEERKEQARLLREEAEQKRREQEEQERLRKEEEEKKERERKAKEEAEKRKREGEQKARQEAERLKREQEEQERLQREEEQKAPEISKPPEAERGLSRTKIFAVIIVLSAALLGYWGFIALSHDDTITIGYQPHDGTITIGYQPSTHQLAAMVAAENGWWEEDLSRLGIEEVNLLLFPSGGSEMSAMLAGDLDVAYVGTESPIAAMYEGLDIKVVAGVQTQGSAIIIRSELVDDYEAEGPISLNGKKIATYPFGSIQHTLLLKWLKENGIDPETDVYIMALGPSDAISAIRAKSVDAVFLPSPYPALIEEEGTGKIVKWSGEIWPNHACCCLVASEQMMREHPDIVKQIIRTHINATEYVNEHPDEAAEIFAKWQGADAATIKHSMIITDARWIHDQHLEVESSLEYAQVIYELNRERYEVKGIAVLGEREIFDTSFYDELTR